MREILFRGKRLDNGKWVVSGSFVRMGDDGINWDYLIGAGHSAMHTVDLYGNVFASVTSGECLFYKVDPETVGQFTGLTDKNGKRIYEGDIIKSDNGKQSAISVVKFGEYYPKMFYKMLDMLCPHRKHMPAKGFYAESIEKEEMILFQSPCVEVIGNIYDNPELLEG